MNRPGIYKIRNTVNGNCYIGSSKHLDKRIKTHRNRLRRNAHRNQHLQNAYNKYGKDSFVFSKLLYCDVENLLVYEQMIIDELEPEYNICPIAGNTLGVIPNKETRRKMSKAHKGKRLTEEHKRKISKALMGHAPTLLNHTKEAKNKISDSLVGHEISSETRKKISKGNKGKHSGSDNGMYGKTHTEDTKNKISKANSGKAGWNKGIPHTEKTKQKMRLNHADFSGKNHPNFGKRHSEETKQKISRSLKAYHDSVDSNN